MWSRTFHPDSRKGLREGDHVFVLDALAQLAKPWMIAVLLSALGIPAGSLKVTIGKRTDPNVSPGRWHGK